MSGRSGHDQDWVVRLGDHVLPPAILEMKTKKRRFSIKTGKVQFEFTETGKVQTIALIYEFTKNQFMNSRIFKMNPSISGVAGHMSGDDADWVVRLGNASLPPAVLQVKRTV